MNGGSLVRNTLQRPNSVLVRIVQLIVAIVLIVSGWSHLQNEMMFYADILQYRLCGSLVAWLASGFLPWLQICAGVGFIIGVMPKGSCLIGCLLFTIYSIAQVVIVMSGRNVNCGCFGVLHSEPISFTTVTGSVTLLCMSAFITYAHFSCDDKSNGLRAEVGSSCR